MSGCSGFSSARFWARRGARFWGSRFWHLGRNVASIIAMGTLLTLSCSALDSSKPSFTESAPLESKAPESNPLSTPSNPAKTLTIAISAPVGAINPQGYGSNAIFAQDLVYEGLTKLDKAGNIIPSLATSWEISDKGTRYTFTLRKGVRFSNGEAFDADAALLNFRSILRNRAAHSWAGLALALDRVEKLDSHTIALILKHPYTPTLNELSFVRPFRFLAPSAFPSDLDLNRHDPAPIGTGAYALARHEKSQEIFTRNPYYTDRESGKVPYFDTIIARIIFDPSSKLAALKTGQIDAIYGQESISLDSFREILRAQNPHATNANNALRAHISPPAFTISLVLNPSSPALSTAPARKALLQVLDPSELIAYVYGDLATPARSLYAPNSTLLAALTPQEPLPRSCTPARALPALAGTSKPLELAFISNNPAQKMLAEIIQAQAKSCGITLSLKGIEPSAYTRRLVSGGFDLAFAQTWGAPYEPLSHLHSMQTLGHIEYALLAALAPAEIAQKSAIYTHIAAAIAATDPAAMTQHIQKALDLLASTYLIFPLAHERNLAITSGGIGGVEMGVNIMEAPIAKWYR